MSATSSTEVKQLAAWVSTNLRPAWLRMDVEREIDKRLEAGEPLGVITRKLVDLATKRDVESVNALRRHHDPRDVINGLLREVADLSAKHPAKQAPEAQRVTDRFCPRNCGQTLIPDEPHECYVPPPAEFWDHNEMKSTRTKHKETT